MKLTSYFIKHPVVAIVLNVMILILGIVCFDAIPVREYPAIRLPVFNVSAFYANASAELVESSVTNVLEDRLAGLEGLDFIESQSKQGASHITLSFNEGFSTDRALIAIRDAVALARRHLPKNVQEPVVEQAAESENFPFMALALSSERLPAEINHYANLYLKNSLRSLPGLAKVEVWGQMYMMKVTLDPLKLYTYGINAHDVYATIDANNRSWPLGKYQDRISASLPPYLSSVSAFEHLYLKDVNEKPIDLMTVADVALKSDEKTFRTRVNGKPGLLIALFQGKDANPLLVSEAVRQKVEEMKKKLPKDMSLKVVLDKADFIRASLGSIQKTIFEAILLVMIIVFIFLRNIRATLVPLVTVPISLVGSLLFLTACGFSINTLTLLAMVMAIGLVVDDAIVVLENISHHREAGEPPLQAALKGAQEIGFAIIAMTLTLASVYAPIAFIKGAVGQLFVEFAVTLAGAVLISGIVALTLSPLMCRHIFKREEKRLFPSVDVFLASIERGYGRILAVSLTHTKVILGSIVGLAIALVVLFRQLPQELAPKEDRGIIGMQVPPAPGRDIDVMDHYMMTLEKQLASVPEGQEMLSFLGWWGGVVILMLKPHEERTLSAAKIVKPFEEKMPSLLPSADAYAWSEDSALPGVDGMEGKNLKLVLTTTKSYREFLGDLEKTKKALEAKNVFETVKHNLRLDVPAYEVITDQHTMAHLGITPDQLSQTIEIFFSGRKDLTFQMDSISYPISIEGKDFPWTLDEMYITSPKGKKISIGTFAQLKKERTATDLKHLNQKRMATLSGSLKPDQNLKEAMAELMATATETLPSDVQYEWTGMAKMYLKSSYTMVFLFGMALLFIYAILAIQFESFVDPLIVMLTVPLACFGALLMAWIFGQSINIYTQVGLVTLIGLISKHGILIVEFANQQRAAGKSAFEAIQEAAQRRLRPILMTTGAMIFGSLPLILSPGAGSEARSAIGFVLLGGLSIGTLFTLLIIPKVYLMAKNAAERMASP